VKAGGVAAGRDRRAGGARLTVVKAEGMMMGGEDDSDG